MWTLDMLEPDGAEWRTVESKPSADACRAWARVWAKTEPRRAFRLFRPDGRLWATAGPRTSWRMRWQDGNGMTREQLAATARVIRMAVTR